MGVEALLRVVRPHPELWVSDLSGGAIINPLPHPTMVPAALPSMRCLKLASVVRTSFVSIFTLTAQY